MKEFAVVTGASSGLGRCFALELAARGIDTILVALPGTGTEKVAEQARNLGTESVVMEADLTDRTSVNALCMKINSGYRVFMLINNAGTGGSARFTECPAEYIDNIIQLNVAAVALMTRNLLPKLVESRESYILNISSMAAFTPIGYKTVYPATKRFILDFTLGLREELHGSGVHVCCMHPGPMKTNPDAARRIEKQGRFGRIGLLSPEKVARTGIDRMLKNKGMIIPGWMNRLNKVLTDIVPAGIRIPLVTRIISRETH